MSKHCSNYEDLMAEALFGELAPEEERRLNAHLDTCDACAEEFQSLQATLAVTAERTRPEPPEVFWRGYWPRLVRRMRRAEAPAPSWTTWLAAWWREVTALPPAVRYALQGAVAVLLVVGGFWLGQQAAPDAQPPLLSGTETPAQQQSADGALAHLVGATGAVEIGSGTIRPRLANIRDITYDVSDGTVEIRYNTVNDIIVRGTPDDPTVQRLLRTAMLDEQDPSARLNALQTVERAQPTADPELTHALTYLAREEADPNMRFRAVRALKSLHQEAPLPDDTRGVLINILLQSDNSALRIEALQALMSGPPASEEATPDYLYEVQNDSNSYLRYQATQALQERASVRSSTLLDS